MKYHELSPEEQAAHDQRQVEWAEKVAKDDAVARINDRFLADTADDFPIVDVDESRQDAVKLLRTLRSAVTVAARSPKLEAAFERAKYARTQRRAIRNGTLATDYDPNTDPNWPA